VHAWPVSSAWGGGERKRAFLAPHPRTSSLSCSSVLEEVCWPPANVELAVEVPYQLCHGQM
jgi:hypothetical protein